MRELMMQQDVERRQPGLALLAESEALGAGELEPRRIVATVGATLAELLCDGEVAVALLRRRIGQRLER